MSSRSGANGMAASPTRKAVKCPNSVKVGLTAAVPTNAATVATWHRGCQGRWTYPDNAPATPNTK
jgi:hypothetical protein